MKYYLSNVLNGFRPEDTHIELEIKMRQTPNFVIVDIDQDDMPEILFTYNYMGEKYIGVLKRKNMQWYFVQTMPEKEQKAIGLGNLVNTVEGMVITPNDLGKAVDMQMLFGNKAQAFVSLVNDVVTHGTVSPGQMNIQPSQSVNTQSNQQMNIQPNQSVNTQSNQQMNMQSNQSGNTQFNQPVNTQFNQQTSMQPNQSMNAQSKQQSNLNDVYLQNLTQEQINQLTSEKLPPPQQINTPTSQKALNENLVTPIMSVTETDTAVNATPFIQPTPNMNPGQTGNTNNAYLQDLTEAQINQILNEQLPPSQQINTPTSQQALNQDVITPIMNVNQVQPTVPNVPINSGMASQFPNATTNSGMASQFPNAATNSGMASQFPNTAINNGMASQFPNTTMNNGMMNGIGLGQQGTQDVYNYGQSPLLDKEVINFAQADVTGDGRLDSIYLVGNRKVGDPTRFIEGMGLRVKTEGRTLAVDFPYGNGYSPVLFIGDLTRDGIPDVLVNIFASNTGGFLTSYIYTFQNEEPRMLFDSKAFNETYTGKVIYEDNYVVRVLTNRPPWQYTIDLSDREADYLSGLYDQNGKLRRPTEGTLLGLNSFNPSDYDVNGEYNVSSIQRVIGTGNLDTLGLVETYLAWRDATQRFEPFMQYLSVLGRPR